MSTSSTARAIGRAALIIAMLALGSPAAHAGEGSDATTTPETVRTEVAEAMQAIAEYSAQQRDQALARAQQALHRIDAEIERREQRLRENWAQMSEAAREKARTSLRELREARNALGERYGALQSGAAGAWDELKAGFSDAWQELSRAWSGADERGQTKGQRSN